MPLPPDTYRVSELGEELRHFVGEAFAGFWVGGEVQRPRAARSGHLYFELVEKGAGDEIVGRIDAVLWRRDHQRVRAMLRRFDAEIGEGQLLRCFGSVDFYPPGGRLQLIVRDVDPLFVVGELAKRRQATLAELRETGLLARNAALSLPAVPLELGLVAAPGSAGAHDFLATLRSSGYGFVVSWAEVKVQGFAAERELERAIASLGRGRYGPLDAIVVVRGGGARADLAAFDSRRVAKAIAMSTVPVLAGIGHQIDRSVVDEVAHSSFKTPTEVGEFLVRRVRDAEEHLSGIERDLVRESGRLLERTRDRLGALARGLTRAETTTAHARLILESAARELVRVAARRLELGRHLTVRHAERLRASVPPSLRRARERRRAAARSLVEAARHRTQLASERALLQERLCQQLDPQRTLERGFSITRGPAGDVLRSAAVVGAGDVIETELAEGRLTSRIEGQR